MKMNPVSVALAVAVIIGLFASRGNLGGLVLATESLEEKTVDRLVDVKDNPNTCPCCNKCGVCDRRAPQFARCQCLDFVSRCHPSCRKCVAVVFPPGIHPTISYRCDDIDFYSCQRKCIEPYSFESIN